MRYAAMLGHVDHSGYPAGILLPCKRGGSTPRAVWTGQGAGDRGTGAGRQPDDRPSVVSRKPSCLCSRSQPRRIALGNLKGRELANPCPAAVAALRSPVRAGCERIRRQPALAFAFLKHACLEHADEMTLLGLMRRLLHRTKRLQYESDHFVAPGREKGLCVR
jgi:hypothetical protein